MIRNLNPKTGRNKVCPYCTSGKKLKHCCMAPQKAEALTPARVAGHTHERPTLFAYTEAPQNRLMPFAVVKKQED